MLRSVFSALALALVSSTAAGGVLIVDKLGTSGTYTTIQAAVDAAVDGDTIYVRAQPTSPVFGGFTITNKTLVVTGELAFGPNFPHINGLMRVQNLAANKAVTLSHLHVVGNPLGSTINIDGAALFVDQCAGAVRIQECWLQGAKWIDAHPSGYPGAILLAASNVAFAATTAIGGKGKVLCSGGGTDPTVGGAGSVALYAQSSNCAWHDGELIGGAGGDGCINGGAGGIGVYAFSGSTTLVHTMVTGGVGGWAIDFIVDPQMVPGDGGAGVYAETGASVRLVECQVVGGDPGETISGPFGPYGQPGAVFSGGGSFVLEPGPTRSLTLQSSVASFAPAQLDVRAPAGDTVLLFLGAAPGPLLAIPNSAPFMIKLPALGPVAFGPVPGSGLVSLPINGPVLPAGILGASILLQVASFGPSNAGFSNMIHFTILDPSI